MMYGLHGSGEAVVEERLPFEIPAMIRFYSVRPAQISPQAGPMDGCCLCCPPLPQSSRSDTLCTQVRVDALTHCTRGRGVGRDRRGERERSRAARTAGQWVRNFVTLLIRLLQTGYAHLQPVSEKRKLNNNTSFLDSIDFRNVYVNCEL